MDINDLEDPRDEEDLSGDLYSMKTQQNLIDARHLTNDLIAMDKMDKSANAFRTRNDVSPGRASAGAYGLQPLDDDKSEFNSCIDKSIYMQNNQEYDASMKKIGKLVPGLIDRQMERKTAYFNPHELAAMSNQSQGNLDEVPQQYERPQPITEENNEESTLGNIDQAPMDWRAEHKQFLELQ